MVGRISIRRDRGKTKIIKCCKVRETVESMYWKDTAQRRRKQEITAFGTLNVV